MRSAASDGHGRRRQADLADAVRVVGARRPEIDDEVFDERGQGHPRHRQTLPNSNAAIPAAAGDAALVPLKHFGA